MAGGRLTMEEIVLETLESSVLSVHRIHIKLTVTFPRNATVDLERAEKATQVVAAKFGRDLKKLVVALDASVARKLKGWEKKDAERVVKLVKDSRSLVRRTNAGLSQILKRLRPVLRKSLATVTKLDVRQIGVVGGVRFNRITLKPRLLAIKPPDAAEKLAQDLVDKLEIRSKWMFCSMALVGRKAVIKLSLWKPLTKDQRMALRRAVKGTAKAYEGACKTSGVLLFRFVDRKSDLPKDLDVILKRLISDAVGKSRKITVGDPLPEVPLQLSKIAKMD